MHMAKKKAAKKRITPAPREASFRFRMSEEFKAWLEEYAAYRQLSAADTVAHSIMAAAKADGFRLPPRR